MKHLGFPFAVLALLLATFLTNGCKKEEDPASPPPQVEHPPATLVTLIIMDSLGTSFVDSCSVRDTSQVHGGLPVVGELDLQSGKTYQGRFRLYDETQSPVEDITADIVSEKDAHVFKFTYTSSRVVISNRDLDSHGLPFGLTFTLSVTPGGAETGNLHVILEHHDDGDKSGAEFDLDLDRDFPVSITP